jgi:hypothetical protein
MENNSPALSYARSLIQPSGVTKYGLKSPDVKKSSFILPKPGGLLKAPSVLMEGDKLTMSGLAKQQPQSTKNLGGQMAPFKLKKDGQPVVRRFISKI